MELGYPHGLIVLTLSLCSAVNALQCYQCVAVSSSSSFINTVGHTDPNCESVSYYGTTKKTCQAGEVCGYLNGKVDLSVPVFGSTTITLHVRDCMSVLSGTSMKCYRNQYYTDVINTVLSFIRGFANVKFDGDVCFCDGNLCEPCDSQSVVILGRCFAYWVFGVIGGGICIIILLICCCCCCCCRKSRPVQQPAVIIQKPGTMVIQPQPYNSPQPHSQQPFQVYQNPVYS